MAIESVQDTIKVRLQFIFSQGNNVEQVQLFGLGICEGSFCHDGIKIE